MALDTSQLDAATTAGILLALDTLAGSERVQYVKLLSGVAASEVPVHTGNGLAANALSVSIASDSTGQVKLAEGNASTIIGKFTVGSCTTNNQDPCSLVDKASSTSGAGMNVLFKRMDTPANVSGSDLDFEFPTMSNGRVNVAVSGSVAHDSALGAVDKPILSGAVCQEMDGSTLDPVACAAGDVTYIRADRDGRQLTNQSHPASGSYNFEGSAAQTETVAVAQPASGFSVYITGLYCSAITAQTLFVHDEDDNVLIPLQYFGANTGTVRMDLSAHPIKVTAVKAVEFTSTAAVAHSVLLQYYVAP